MSLHASFGRTQFERKGSTMFVALVRVRGVGAKMRLRALFRHGVFLWGCVAILIVALTLAVWASFTAQWLDMLAWVAIAVTAALALGFRDRFPVMAGFLLALAAAVNGAGYTFTLWHQETLFDEIVHAFTSFAGMTAIGWTLRRSNQARRLSQLGFFAGLVAIGMLVGVMWEGFEWLVGVIGSPRDTAIDLIADGFGAVAAALLACRFKRRTEKHESGAQSGEF